MTRSRRYSGWQGDIDLLEVGKGDNDQGWSTTTQGRVQIAFGSASDPDRGLHPCLKVVRTQEVAQSDGIVGDGSEQLAAIEGLAVGSADTQGQPVGVLGFAKSASTQSSQNDDAAGVYGVGRITGSGTGTGIGVVATGRRDTSTGRCTGIEIASDNETEDAGSYSAVGYATGLGAWVVASGDADSGAGIAVGNPFGRQFEVGLGFTGQVTGGKTGGVSTASIRDDGNATTVMDVNGSHTNGIDMAGATISGAAILLAAGHKIQFGASGPTVSSGSGAPENVVSAPVGSLYLRTDGGVSTTLYVKTSGTGNTGWTAK